MLLIVDEFSAIADGAHVARMIEVVRSYGGAVVLAVQAYEGMGGDFRTVRCLRELASKRVVASNPRGVPRVRVTACVSGRPRCSRQRRSRSSRPEPIPWVPMASNDEKLTVASEDVDAAIATATAIDADELERARLDQRWREFCLNAEQYVAETTRQRPRAGQTA
ncbi:MAG: hypothetical protein ACRDM0_20130 [Thermoleophilaceae bacterium]